MAPPCWLLSVNIHHDTNPESSGNSVTWPISQRWRGSQSQRVWKGHGWVSESHHEQQHKGGLESLEHQRRKKRSWETGNASSKSVKIMLSQKSSMTWQMLYYALTWFKSKKKKRQKYQPLINRILNQELASNSNYSQIPIACQKR